MTGYESKKKAAQNKLDSMEREALKLSLKTFESMNHDDSIFKGEFDGEIAVIKEALAQPAQEPVAWSVIGNGKFGKYKLGQTFVDYEATHIYWKNRGYELVPLYTTPPQRTWVGLTDEEIDAIYEQHHNQYGECESPNFGYERAIEAKLKEKNNG